MADLNELLREGAAETEGLAAESARARQTVDRLLRLSAGLSAAVEAGSGEAHRRLDQLAARLHAAEQELGHENAAAVASLQGLQASALQVRGQAGHFLERVRSDLAQLREEKERTQADLEHEDDAARERVLRYGSRVRDLEHEAGEHLAEARGVTDVLRQQVEAVRTTVGERRQALLAELQALEDGLRHRLDELIKTYEQMAAVVEEQVSELQATSRSLSDQVAAGLSRRLQGEALASLAAATRPLKDAIDGLQELVQEGRAATAERFGEIAGRIEDVTGGLERLRSPLGTVKQHLR
jgi:hypothetical protein